MNSIPSLFLMVLFKLLYHCHLQYKEQVHLKYSLEFKLTNKEDKHYQLSKTVKRV